MGHRQERWHAGGFDLIGDFALRQEFGLVLPALSIVVVISLLRESLYGGKQIERRKAGGDGISVRRLISKGWVHVRHQQVGHQQQWAPVRRQGLLRREEPIHETRAN